MTLHVSHPRTLAVASVFAIGLTAYACTTPPAPAPPEPTPKAVVAQTPAPPVAKPTPQPLPTPKPPKAETPKDQPNQQSSYCPADMRYVEVESCDQVKQTCTKKGKFDRSNHPPICAAYSEERPCVGEMRTLRFCMDTYEYPNKKGAHPPVMVDALDAHELCAEQGKRLCWAREWTAACEGSKREPYPYGGFERDPSKCRVDEPWIRPIPSEMVSRDPKAHDAEMRKLDGSVPSGSMAGCKSDFGVYDLTGNFDEWVYIEKPAEKATWAGLKGGWWGPLRNTCRPVTTNHPENFIFYAVSFRCCKDASPTAMQKSVPNGQGALWMPPKPPAPKRKFGKTRRGWTPDYDIYSVYNDEHADIRPKAKQKAQDKLDAWDAKRKKWEENLKSE